MMTVLKPKYRIELAVERRSHIYRVYGDDDQMLGRFTSVTKPLDIISKPALINWAKKESLKHVRKALIKRLRPPLGDFNRRWIANVLKEAKARPDKIKNDAADLGTRAHAFIDSIIHGREPEAVPKEISAPVQAFKDWWKDSGIELVLGDTKVASIIHKYGGSLDALGRRNGKYIILDWKVRNFVFDETALQLAAYGQAFTESYGVYVQEGIAVRFGKKLPIDFEARSVVDLEKSFKAFLAAKALSESLQEDHFHEAVTCDAA